MPVSYPGLLSLFLIFCYCYFVTKINRDFQQRGMLVKEIDVTWLRALKVWWSITWRSMLLGFFICVLVTFAMFAFGLKEYVGLTTSIIGILVGIAAVKFVLGKTYKDFRLVLVKNEAHEFLKKAEKEQNQIDEGGI